MIVDKSIGAADTQDVKIQFSGIVDTATVLGWAIIRVPLDTSKDDIEASAAKLTDVKIDWDDIHLESWRITNIKPVAFFPL